MVTFTEEILHGKIHFLCSVMLCYCLLLCYLPVNVIAFSQNIQFIVVLLSDYFQVFLSIKVIQKD